jgi:hypothetical protein
VYLIGGDDITRYKIGHAAAVRERLAALNVASPFPLRVFATFQGGRGLETELHEHFDRWRVHGEWFEFGELDAVRVTAQAVAQITADEYPRLLPQRWAWPDYDESQPYYIPPEELSQHTGTEPRCACGHQQGSHNMPPFRPECSGDVTSIHDYCLCGRFMPYEPPPAAE